MTPTENLPLIKGKALSEVSTLHIGGPARYYLEAKEVKTLRHALEFCRVERMPFFILGKGSNSLFDDKGFDGCIIHNKIDFCNQIAPGTFHCGAGHSFSRLGCMTARKGWTGLEFASGIPASVGGAVFMNAGANGGETKDSLTEVEFLTTHNELKTFPRSKLTFAYRYSSFQRLRGCITAATFQLTASNEARQKQTTILTYRKETQPLSDWSAGCAFRNPTGGSAGALIDQCGLKGTRIGDAEVSPMHANFIVNKGQATAQDVLDLMDLIQKTVYEKTGQYLETEIRKVPYTLPFEEKS